MNGVLEFVSVVVQPCDCGCDSEITDIDGAIRDSILHFRRNGFVWVEALTAEVATSGTLIDPDGEVTRLSADRPAIKIKLVGERW